MEITNKINLHRNHFYEVIEHAQFTEKLNSVEYLQWFDKVLLSLRVLKEKDKKLFIIGNGASAAISDHFAADFSKNAYIPTFSNTEAALITAFSNDYSYESGQMEILKRKMSDGDGIILVSSSGASKNLINALNYVLDNYKNSSSLTLTAFKPDNPLRQLGHFNLYVPAQDYSFAESAHAYYLHLITDLFFNPDWT